MDQTFINHIFSGNTIAESTILTLFRYQYAENKIYHAWCQALHIHPEEIVHIRQIPFLPISFFKTQKVVCGQFVPELVFESSGTTSTVNSHHYIKDANLYVQSFTRGFEEFYGQPDQWCIIGLLPNYLERKNSSLIKMAHDLIALSGHPDSGFYLYDFAKLADTLLKLEAAGQKTLLLGVSFALLDFAEAYPMPLQHTIIMETGGMKGRKKELTREEFHGFLEKQFGIAKIHSEYGMTELLSQGYSKGDGLYQTPPWMRVLVRDENDPLHISESGQGILNIIDMANIYSCSFIATDDVGIVYPDHSFEVRGRLDNSDLRGCSLLVL